MKGRVGGYSTHRTELRKAVEALGIEVTSDIDADYDIAIHVVGPHCFHPVPSKHNILLTTVDSTEVTHWSDAVHQASALVVPCRYNASVLSRYYRGPIHIVPEGIQPEFIYTERHMPGPDEPFRFLFHGAWDCCRKGLDLAFIAFEQWFQSGRMPPNVQLVLKTYSSPFRAALARLGPRYATLPGLASTAAPSCFGSPGIASYFRNTIEDPREAIYPPDYLKHLISETDPRAPAIYPAAADGEINDGPEGLPEIIIDQRDLPLDQLLELYRASHAFVLPTRSEGWGLTLTNALASGLPSVWTNWGAMLDYATEDMGYQLKNYHMVQVYASQIPGVIPLCAEPEVQDIIEAMEAIYHNYAEATKRARVARERMRPYTWASAAQRFIEICYKYIRTPATVAERAKGMSADPAIAALSTVAANFKNVDADLSRRIAGIAWKLVEGMDLTPAETAIAAQAVAALPKED